MFKSLRSRSGQIVLPALFVFPSLMLFVYLIFETAKLSREKIRHQFAIDAAAFVEMTNYSDFLNRTAYVNGAFPMRIFDEGFAGYEVPCDKKTDKCQGPISMKTLLYQNGAFPSSCTDAACKENITPGQNPTEPWAIKFADSPPGSGKNDARKGRAPDVQDKFDLLTWNNAHEYWINWDEANQVYKLYRQIYSLLGSVESAQYSVLQRLTEKHNFLIKSYWLNTGEPMDQVNNGGLYETFHNQSKEFKADAYCHMFLRFYGNKPTNDPFQPWQEYAPGQQPGDDPKNPTPQNYVAVPEMSCKDGMGLFQLMWVDPGVIQSMQSGYEVSQKWSAPKNYFDINFNRGMRAFGGDRPFVHARVTLGETSSNGPKPSVWPNPTPKFQTRLYP